MTETATSHYVEARGHGASSILSAKPPFTTSSRCGRVSDRPRGPRNKHGQGLIGFA
jgi:hypothetical protein